MTDKTAQDHVDDMTDEPTLDKWFDRNPADLTDSDIRQLVQNERQKRADFIAKDGE